MEFEAQFPNKAHPQQAHGQSRQMSLPTGEVGEACRRQVQVAAGGFQHGPAVGPGHVDGGIGRGDVGDVQFQSPLGVPAQHVPVDPVHAGGGRGHVEMVLSQARCHAIVHHHTLLIGEYGVAGAAHRQFQEAVGVNAVQEFRRVRPP